MNAEAVLAVDRPAQPNSGDMAASQAGVIRRSRIYASEREPIPTNTTSKRTRTDTDIYSQSESVDWGCKSSRTKTRRADLKRQSKAEYLDNAKKTFISKWAKKTKAFDDWEKLTEFAYIG